MLNFNEKIPFGRYKDRNISKIYMYDYDYFKWLCMNNVVKHNCKEDDVSIVNIATPYDVLTYNVIVNSDFDIEEFKKFRDFHLNTGYVDVWITK